MPRDLDSHSIQLTAGAGLPSTQELGLTAADLLKPLPWATGVDNSSTLHVLERRESICTFGLHSEWYEVGWGPIADNMWEENALRAAYNYLMYLGTDYYCGVVSEHVADVWVSGWVNGFWVEVGGWRRKGVNGWVSSYCLHAAMAMEMFLLPEFCWYPMGNYVIGGGAWKAHGNGDLWVTTWL
ncbi:hypothetical protein B0T14DRAFT_518593 [Immersiella caudata]|uniref:Uncharacterized protein n=1 Tax=Immersiella caudata TaxID=314043 RepID=A0AA39WPC8_9PEZI|nr:hypothetical protein B0T14DRAFT_518593 [Immersiella caudata]